MSRRPRVLGAAIGIGIGIAAFACAAPDAAADNLVPGGWLQPIELPKPPPAPPPTVSQAAAPVVPRRIEHRRVRVRVRRPPPSPAPPSDGRVRF